MSWCLRCFKVCSFYVEPLLCKREPDDGFNMQGGHALLCELCHVEAIGAEKQFLRFETLHQVSEQTAEHRRTSSVYQTKPQSELIWAVAAT